MLDKQPTSPPSSQAGMGAVPGDEGQRLHTLAAYGLASTPSEADFDNFAAMAADLFRLPIGLINLVGERHLTVKGRSGLHVGSIPREGAFCAYTIRSDSVFVVPDLAADARFADHPLVTELGFRFYAGAPLVSPMGGHRIGTLCIVDRAPHPPQPPGHRAAGPAGKGGPSRQAATTRAAPSRSPRTRRPGRRRN